MDVECNKPEYYGSTPGQHRIKQDNNFKDIVLEFSRQSVDTDGHLPATVTRWANVANGPNAISGGSHARSINLALNLTTATPHTLTCKEPTSDRAILCQSDTKSG